MDGLNSRMTSANRERCKKEAVYLVLFTASLFNVHSVSDSVELLTLTIFLLIFSFCCVVSSVMLLVGLCVDNRLFLLPWVASVSGATILELTVSIYFAPDAVENPSVAIFFVADIMFCALSVYCILCVISQYQQYLAGRGRAGQGANCPPIPTVRFQPSMGGPSQNKNVPSVSFQVSHQNGACKPGMLLMVPTPNSSSMSSKSLGHTDLSSVSDENSSCDISRSKNSTDDTAAATEEEEGSNDVLRDNIKKCNTLTPCIVIETEEETSLDKTTLDPSNMV